MTSHLYCLLQQALHLLAAAAAAEEKSLCCCYCCCCCLLLKPAAPLLCAGTALDRCSEVQQQSAHTRVQ
jgi:hypothetical protein